MAIVSTQKGRQAFISNRGIHFLCEINVKQTFQCEDALKLLLNILTIEGWDTVGEGPLVELTAVMAGKG
jgi:hypothetical protein